MDCFARKYEKINLSSKISAYVFTFPGISRNVVHVRDTIRLINSSTSNRSSEFAKNACGKFVTTWITIIHPISSDIEGGGLCSEKEVNGKDAPFR